MGNISRRHYDKEFKIEAVRLVTEGGPRVSEVARDLEISSNTLYRWRRQFPVRRPTEEKILSIHFRF